MRCSRLEIIGDWPAPLASPIEHRSTDQQCSADRIEIDAEICYEFFGCFGSFHQADLMVRLGQAYGVRYLIDDRCSQACARPRNSGDNQISHAMDPANPPGDTDDPSCVRGHKVQVRQL